jgi:hypothetical protein
VCSWVLNGAFCISELFNTYSTTFRSEGYRTDPFTNSMREIYSCLICQEIGHHPAQSSSHLQDTMLLSSQTL